MISPEARSGRQSLKFEGIFIGSQTKNPNQAQFMGGGSSATNNNHFFIENLEPLHMTLDDIVKSNG